MSVLIKYMAMPKGCIYANDKDQTEYCPLLNHDDVPFCQYIENEPEIAIGIDERPVYCPLSDVPEPCQDAVSRQAAIDAIKKSRYLVDAMEKVIKLPSVQPDGIPLEWIDKHLEWLDNCDNDFAQIAKVSIRAMVEIWKKDKT